MRLSFASIILFLGLVVATVTLSLARGQTPPATPSRDDQSPAAPSQRDPVVLLDRIKALTEQLQLTPDQKTQIDTVFKKAADDMQSAKEDLQNASDEEKTARFRDLLSDLRQQVGAVLSDDQKLELQQKLQSLRSSTTAPNAAPSGEARNGTGAATPNVPGQRRGGLGQNGGFAGSGGTGGPGRGGQLLQRLKSNLDQLGLTADQQSQVDGLLKETQQQVQAIRQGILSGSIKRPDAREKIRSIIDTMRTGLGGILTPDQLDKLHQSMQQNGGAPEGRSRGAPLGNTPPSLNAPKSNLPNSKPASLPVQTPSAAASSLPVAVAAPAPAAGQPAPDFSLRTLDGETAATSSYNHKLLVLVLGSYTNPPFRDKAAGLEALREQYGSRGVNFLIIYTRETHPAGGWEVERNKTDNIEIAQPATEAERKSTAQNAKTAMNLSISMATDTMDDKTAKAYAVGDSVPAYLIGRDGKILFHQSWLEPMALGEAIEDALK